MPSRSTQADPPEIQQKIQALYAQNSLIKQIQSNLSAAQLERDRLEREIFEYRASVAPIQKCPEEVLLMIFELYSNYNPQLVTHLLPVCRHWYNIAVNAPQLWNHIGIFLPET